MARRLRYGRPRLTRQRAVVTKLWYLLAPALSAALLLLPLPAHADSAAGEHLARQWCANCHVIDGTGPRSVVQQGPPGFHAVARHLDPAQLRTFLSHPHGAMPDLALTRAEIEDLIAYIESLK